ncbi:TadE/TadG family type IV pilus assembly protein [Cohnella laeviribosi]|uniref:TadE/TadG family type IV pilus assembly protein n=1 Tax=Cohnella laeviribosi TaxID=380174 RepID=UPI00036C15E4|nr:TadE/TadG family type IV pilus assembly protein [Cohnella laeviribosi]
MRSRFRKNRGRFSKEGLSLRAFFQDRRGSASLEFVILLPFLLFFLLIGFDFMRWIVAAFSIQHVADLAMREIQESGFDGRLSLQVSEWMENNRLDPEQWSGSVTTVGNGRGSLVFRSAVRFRAFSLFGWNVSVPVEARRTFDKRDRVVEGQDASEGAQEGIGLWDEDP